MITNSISDLPLKEIQNIPVYIFDRKQFKAIYEYGDQYHCRESIEAYFVSQDCHPLYNPPLIAITEGFSVAHQLFLFFHEYGHYECYNKKCSCIYYKSLSEEHAWRNSFKLMLHYKCYQSLIIALERVKQYKNYFIENTDTKARDYHLIRDLFLAIEVGRVSYLYHKVQKWVRDCPQEYKENLIEIK